LARESGADAIVANGAESIGAGRVRALWVATGKIRPIEGTKTELADRILDLAEPMLDRGASRGRSRPHRRRASHTAGSHVTPPP